MDTNQARTEKTPTSPKASGESRAIGESATETAFVSVYDAALMGVALMAGPMGGQPRPIYDFSHKVLPT